MGVDVALREPRGATTVAADSSARRDSRCLARAWFPPAGIAWYQSPGARVIGEAVTRAGRRFPTARNTFRVTFFFGVIGTQYASKKTKKKNPIKIRTDYDNK